MALNQDFEAFAADAWPRLVRAARLMGASQDAAEDASQSVLVACYQRWRKIGRLADSPYAYVYRCLSNELKRKRSRAGREVLVAEVHHAPGKEAVATTEPNEGGMQPALAALPPAQRAVIVCSFYLDLSDNDTATVLGVPIGTVKSRKSRALAALAANPVINTEHSLTREVGA